MIAPPSIGSAAAAPAADGFDYTDINGLEALKSDPQSPEGLKAVAEQVEALFLQMMLKSMREASGGDGIFDSNEGRMYQDMFDKQIALSISRRQDLGIGALLMQQLNKNGAHGAGAEDGHSRESRGGAERRTPGAAPLEETHGKASNAPAASTAGPTPRQFVSSVLPTIERAARKLGVNPLGLLAQAALETGWGQRIAKTADGDSSHNLFGVKTGRDWAGPSVTATTVEFDGRLASRKTAAFRAYASLDDGVADFTKLLSGSPRFREALAAGSDARAYCRAVAAAGYATDPEYANKLNQILSGDTLRAALAPRLAGLQK